MDFLPVNFAVFSPPTFGVFSVVFSFTYFDFFSDIKWVQYQAGNSDKFKLWKSFYNGIITWKGVQNVKPTKWQMSSTLKKLIWVCHTVPKIIWSYRFVLAQCQQCTVKKKKKKGKSISVLQYIVHPVRHDVFGRALLKTFIRKSIYILVRIIKCLKFPHILTWPVIIN